MGMESYNIIALPTDVGIARDKEYWRLEGYSTVPLVEFEKVINNIQNIKKVGENQWVLDECIEVLVYKQNDFFRGIEIRGCLSYLELGINKAFELLEFLGKKVTYLNIYILNENVKVSDSKELLILIQDKYKNKIDIFEKQYNNIQLKVTCGKFYEEMQKRNKWYYKLFYSKKQ